MDTNYRWGTARERAMIGAELAGAAAQDDAASRAA